MKCIPLTNLVSSVRTVSYRQSFPPLMSPSRLGHKSQGTKRGSITSSTDREDEVSITTCISVVCLMGSGTISIHEEQLQIFEPDRKQNESIWNQLFACFSTQFRVKENCYFLQKLRKFGDKPATVWQQEKPYILAVHAGEYGPLIWPITECVQT